MATRRRSAKGKATRKPVRKTRAGALANRARRRARGARRASPREVAREVRPKPVAEPERPQLRLAEAAPVGEAGERGRSVATSVAAESRPAAGPAADREAAELARRIEAAAGSAAEELQRRAEASVELGRRREAMEAAPGREEERDLPGYGAIGLELAVGALRLARTVAMAPIRLGLAFLRPREA